MASNITQIAGATEIELYFRNYVYADALTDLKALTAINFTDLDRVGYKNTGGTLNKFMEDSSGSSNIPANRVLYTDANGRATSSSALTFDGTTFVFPFTYPYGWSFHFTPTTFEIYKDDADIGIKLAEV
jgi:hypothetical protein